MTTDFRSLCAELTGWIERSTRHYIRDPEVLIRARAALAESEPSANNEVAVMTSDLFNDCLDVEFLSSGAKAVLDAYMKGFGWLDSPTKKDGRGIAATLRAAADQVVPDYCITTCVQVRADFLAIATELEALDD